MARKEISREHFQELLAKARAITESAKAQEEADRLAASVTMHPGALTVDLTAAGISAESLGTSEGTEAAVDIIREVIENIPSDAPAPAQKTYGVARDDITLNSKQQSFNDLVATGNDCVLIGAAGTGKTTTMRKVTRSLIDSEKLPKLGVSTRWLGSEKLGAVIVSFTRKAVNNIRHAVVDELKSNTLTIHKLLEFAPIFYEIEDPTNKGAFKNTMRFEPIRNADNPLPNTLKFIAFEEGSMISLELYDTLQEAMPHEHQEVFLGDIQQLPPVFGLAILGFKMLELPVVELTEIYRQALESPIISLAWKILEGNPHDFDSRTEKYEAKNSSGKSITKIRCPALDSFSRETDQGKVFFQVWQKPLSIDLATITSIKQFTAWADQGYYNPEEDIILCPHNEAMGTIEINKGIANHLGRKREATVYEVIAGFIKYYLAVGDRVLYDKEDAVITSITRNGAYLGKHPSPASPKLDRWGAYQDTSVDEKFQLETEEDSEIDVDKLLESTLMDTSNEERVNAASHVVTIKFPYSDETVSLESTGEIKNLLGGYAITVHKAQGSEWEKVFLLLHNSHRMVSRELLYTAVTRAKNFLHIIAETNTFEKGIKSQRIKGNTLAEKAAFFKGEASKRDLDKGLEAKENSKTTMISNQMAVRIEAVCPDDIKRDIQFTIDEYWERSVRYWPELAQFEPPKVSYQLRRKNCLGIAYYTKNVIKINPVWAALSMQDKDIRFVMTQETPIHELCHILTWRLNHQVGHGFYWKQYMERFGLSADRLYTGNALPPWMMAKNDLLEKLFAELKLVDTVEVAEEGEEV